MTAAELQLAIDTAGYASVPAGVTPLDTPLFLGQNQALLGPGRQAARLECYESGAALYVGWRRGLLDGSYFPAGGFRTNGTAHLFARGTEFDLGPTTNGRVAGWPSLGSLRVEYAGTRHGPSWVYVQPNGPFEQVLCGVQGNDVYDQPRPSPWLLWWTNAGVLTLSLRLDTGQIVHLGLPGDPAAADLSVDVTVLLGTGVLTGVVNGEPVTVPSALPPGSKLADNVDWPFTVGRADPWCNSAYWSAKVGDVTHTKTRVSSGSWSAYVDYQAGRLPTYPGGPSLPLIRAWSSRGTRSILAVHKSQGVPDSAGNTTVRGLGIDSGTASPLVTLGGVQGLLTLQDLRLGGGTRAVQCAGLAVSYPVLLYDVQAQFQRDRQLWLFRSSNVTVRDCGFGYGGRGSVTLRGCSALLDAVFVAPPGQPQDAVVEQAGGVVTYSRLFANYEYTPAPPMVRLQGAFFDDRASPTVARLADCVPCLSPPWVVLPKATAYTGPVTVTVDGVTAHQS